MLAKFRKEEQQRAEAARVASIQDQLRIETLLRNRNFGFRSLLGPFGTGGGGRTRSLLGSG